MAKHRKKLGRHYVSACVAKLEEFAVVSWRARLLCISALAGCGWLCWVMLIRFPDGFTGPLYTDGQVTASSGRAVRNWAPPAAVAKPNEEMQASVKLVRLRIVADSPQQPKPELVERTIDPKRDAAEHVDSEKNRPQPAAEPITVQSLLKLPQVHSVTVVSVAAPERRIVHVLNMHYVPMRSYLVFRGYKLPEVQSVPRRKRHKKFVKVASSDIQGYDDEQDDVEAVQLEQEQLLMQLIRRHRVKAIFAEGLSEQHRPLLELFRKYGKPHGHFGPQQGPLDEYFGKQFGALGRLFLSGDLEEVIPAEDLKLWMSADLLCRKPVLACAR